MFKLISLALILLVTGSNCRAPPTISNLSESSDSISMLASDTLTLNCEGEEPITWKTHGRNTINDRAAIDAIKIENDPIPYRATLTVTGTIFTDTGNFACYYSDSNDSQSPEDRAEIYVFVNDPGNLFLQCSPTVTPCFISVPQSLESVIPCLPTSLDVNVTLWKGEPAQLILESDSDVSFDPTRGYVISYGSAFFNGQFKCMGELGNKSEKLVFLLYWFPSSDIIPTPIIHQNTNYAVLNSNFTMMCSVKASQGTYLSLNWEYPNTASPGIKIGDEFSNTRVMRNGEIYRETQRELAMLDVRSDDQGTYACTAKDPTGKSSQKSVYVAVQDEADPFINFALNGAVPNNVFELSLHDNSKMKFVVAVDAFPSDPQLTWYKYEKVLTDGNKYSIKITKTSSSLTISNLETNDTGEYTLFGTTGGVSENITMTLILTEPPQISIQPPPKMYQLAENFVIVCHVQGCPVTNVTWEWSRCDTNGSCGNAFSLLDDSTGNSNSVTEKRKFKDGCHILSILQGTMALAGYYRCSTINPYGSASFDVPVFITDYYDKLGILDHTSTLYQYDELSLFCYASLFYYSSIQWKWMSYDNTSSTILYNSNDTLVVPGTTSYSLTKEVKIHPINLKNAGIYICQAKSVDSDGGWEEVATLITVIVVQRPTVVETNLNNSVYEVFKQDRVEFICSVTGSPFPSITWYLNGTNITGSNSSALEFGENRTKLSISRAIPSDSGFYACKAQNKVGILLLNATLIVLDVSRSQYSKSKVAVAVTIVLIIAFLAISLGIAFGRKIWIEKKAQREVEQLQHMLFNRGNVEGINPELPLEDQVDLLPYDNRWEFPKDRLKLERTIGQGAFGRVVRARATRLIAGQESTTVAVKMLKEHAALEERKALMQELKIMIHLGQAGQHVNVVNLLGAVTENLHKGELLVIVEYCQLGNLRQYLLKNRDNFVNQVHPTTGEIDQSVFQRLTQSHFLGRDSSTSMATTSRLSSPGNSEVLSNGTEYLLSDGSLNQSRLSDNMTKSDTNVTLTTSQLVYYAFQISNGMQYLGSKKLVHRDLALRNVLLADGQIVKICDFGLSKDIYKKAYYRRKGKGPLPIKWMAVEAIYDQVFSSESDVWSFGIVLWETFTLGANPYPGLEVNDEFYKKLLNGYRMEKPELSTGSIYDLMKACWQLQPKARPTFDNISSRLRSMLDERTIRQLNDGYLEMNCVRGSRNALPSHSEYIGASTSDGSSSRQYNNYVPYDKQPVNLDAQNETANYVNLPFPVETLDVCKSKTDEDEIEPLLRRPHQVSQNPHAKTDAVLPDATFTPVSLSNNHSGYLDMGSKTSVNTDAEENHHE